MENQESYVVDNGFIKIKVSAVGATLISLEVRNSDNELYDIVLGHDKLENYQKYGNTYFGATIGRNANRLNPTTFKIAEELCTVEKNEGNNNLHSGSDGFHFKKWKVESYDRTKSITLSYISHHDEQGLPGELKTQVSYQLEKNNLMITFLGETNQTTLFNPTNHSYFNLNGHNNGTIEKHQVQFRASKFTPINQEMIPSGEIKDVAESAFDFRRMKTIESVIETENEQLQLTSGFDHNFIIDENINLDEPFATVVGDQSNIKMKVYTNLPAFQFYTGNSIPSMIGKKNAFYGKRSGFCLETQYCPNAINQEGFEKPLIYKSETIRYITTFSFS